MRKSIRLWALALTLASVPTTAQADQTRNWFVCGGNHFDTCASVFVTVSNSADFVGVSDVELKVWNLSGFNDTFAGTVFTKIGFFHQNYASGGVIEATALAPLSMAGPVKTNKKGEGPDEWVLGNPNNAGGIELDLATYNGDNGVGDGIANACDDSLLPGGQNSFWQNPCGGDDFANDPNAAGWVTINFKIDGQWDLATTELLVFGQNGPDGLSTQCITGAGGNCGTQVVPEPSTWLLLGTGLGALGFVHVRRRRRGEAAADPLEIVA